MSSHLLYPTIDSDLPNIESGQGATLVDENGKDYIDGSSGVMISNIGHGNEAIARIAFEQAKTVAFAYRSQFRNKPSERLARKLTHLAGDKSHAFFLNSGSEANDAAIRVAIQYWKEQGRHSKTRVIGREISNHGNTIATLSVARNKRREEISDITLPMASETIPACYCYRCPLGLSPETCRVDCAAELEKRIDSIGAENVAAFIAEPVTAAAGGVLIPHPGYFQKIADICERNDILLIVDEVVTGLGRTGEWFGMHHWSVAADICVLGKGLNAGYSPLSAVLLSERIVDTIAGGSKNLSIGHTHSANTLSSAIAEGVVDYLQAENILDVVRSSGQRIERRLMQLKQAYPIIGDVRAIGMLAAIEFVADRASRAPFPRATQLSQRIKNAAFDAGLVVYPCRGLMPGELGDAVLIAPPLNSTRAELDTLLARLEVAIERTCDELTAALSEC